MAVARWQRCSGGGRRLGIYNELTATVCGQSDDVVAGLAW